MIIDRRAFLAASAAAAAFPSRSIAASGAVLTPEQFGARGDGTTNDTAAFARLSAEITRRRGGTISLRAGRTYLVGGQTRGGGKFGWNPSPIIELEGLPGPIQIIGNGARLRAQPGLRLGTFDLGSGGAVQHPMPNLNHDDLAIPYRAMIWINQCSGPITIRDIELDGNLERLSVGGQFGDKGWQVPATGLMLRFNTGTETVDNLLTHHHALDGATIVGTPERSVRSRISHLVSRYNGRQGLSVTSGRGYDFADCEFSHTGHGSVQSAPGAGVDIESEGKRPIRDLTFTRCKFLDNRGCGMVADSGDSEGVKFTDCTFVGTTNWSAWPRKPGFSFANCTFVGSLVHVYGGPDPTLAARFTACRFTDDPALSPTGQVFSGAGQAPILATGPDGDALFDGCTFTLVGGAVLPATRSAIYRNCKMSQRSRKPARPIGRYQGTNSIAGPVNLTGSSNEGTLVVNGRQLPPGPIAGGLNR
jgi:hypothetical protein